MKHRMIVVAIVLLIGAIFILDSFLPLGFTVPVLYLIPLLLAIRLPYPTASFFVAGCATVLSILEILTFPGGMYEAGLFNRTLVIIASWTAAATIWHTRWKHTQRELERLVATRTAALQQREHEFRILADNVPALFSYVDRAYRYQYVNKRYEERFGKPRTQLIGCRVEELLGPDTFRVIEPYLETAMGGTPVTFEYSIARPGASPAWVEASYVPDFDGQGKVRGLYALVVDRTAIKETEEALRQSESTLRSFFDSTDLMMGVVEIVDGELATVTSNRSAATMISRTAGMSDGQTALAQHRDPDVWDVWKAHLEEARHTGKTVHFEYRFPSTPATTLSNRIISSAVSFIGLSPRGTPLYSWIEEDITEKKQIEEKIEKSRRSLQASQDRLHQLTAQLMTAQEDERRRISRELHDDLNQRIMGLAFEIEDHLQQVPSLPVEIGESLHTIRNEILELSDQVRNLAHRLHPSVLDDLGIASALRAYAHEFERREHIRVTLSIQEFKRPLGRDREVCLYRVTQETLRNVVKHATASHVHLALTDDGDFVSLEIEDDGCGFESRGEQKYHNGLGLISMGERVRQVQGTMTISSEIGRGTRLAIRLPLEGVSHEQSPNFTG